MISNKIIFGRINSALVLLQQFHKYVATHGGRRDDPMHVKCAIACYDRRPSVWDGELVINGWTNKITGKRHEGLNFRSIGRISFFQSGGIRDVVIFDHIGNVMFSGDKLVKWSRPSPLTQDFHLLDLNDFGYGAFYIPDIATEAEVKQCFDEINA
jgi:hypothetical protein